MDSFTGNCINIGLISDKKDFRAKVVNLVSFLDTCHFERIWCPFGENGLKWEKVQMECCKTRDAVDCCIENDKTWAVGSFRLEGYEIKNVLFHAESLPDDRRCFLMEMPEQQNLFFQDIDRAEEIIIRFLEEISRFEFLYGFCDCEARPEDERYAISVDYKETPNIFLQLWKIDGLTSRN